MDTSQTYDNPTDTSQLYLPTTLKNMYFGDNTNAKILPSEDGQVLWRFMEESIAKSVSYPLSATTTKQITFGQRFEFLKTSFVSKLPHSITKMIKGPKMVIKAKEDLSTVNTNQMLQYAELPVGNWPDLLHLMDNTHVMHPQDLSHGPDVFAKLSNDVDTDQPVRHLLCFQSKYGSQNKSFWHVLDELAKCPFVGVKSKKPAYREFASKQNVNGVNVTYKLTFVYVAMNHANVVKRIRSGKHWTDNHPDFIRCVGSTKCTFFPETVELIVLKKKGLIELLGLEIYQHLKAYKPPTETKNSDDIYSVLEPTPNLKGSRMEVEVQREIRKFVSKYQFFKIKDLVLEQKDPNQSVESNESVESTITLQMSIQTADVTPNRSTYQAQQRSTPTNKKQRRYNKVNRTESNTNSRKSSASSGDLSAMSDLSAGSLEPKNNNYMSDSTEDGAITPPRKNPKQRVINPTGRKQPQSTEELMPPITVTRPRVLTCSQQRKEQQEKVGTTAMLHGNQSNQQPTTNEQGHKRQGNKNNRNKRNQNKGSNKGQNNNQGNKGNQGYNNNRNKRPNPVYVPKEAKK